MLRIIPAVGLLLCSLLLEAQDKGTENDLGDNVHLVVIGSLVSTPSVYIRQKKHLYKFSRGQKSADQVLENKTLGMQINIPADLTSYYPSTVRAVRIRSWLESEFINLQKTIADFTLIKPIYFDFDSYIIRNNTSAQLDKLIELMTACPAINVTVTIHTDQKGSPFYNKQLAKERGKSVEKYLVDSGIDSTRITIIPSKADIVAKSDWKNPISEEKLDQMNRRAGFLLNNYLP